MGVLVLAWHGGCSVFCGGDECEDEEDPRDDEECEGKGEASGW